MLVHLPADITCELPPEPGYGLVPRRLALVCANQRVLLFLLQILMYCSKGEGADLPSMQGNKCNAAWSIIRRRTMARLEPESRSRRTLYQAPK